MKERGGYSVMSCKECNGAVGEEYMRSIDWIIALRSYWFYCFYLCCGVRGRIHCRRGSTHVLRAVDMGMGVTVATEMQVLTGWGKSGAASSVACPGQLSRRIRMGRAEGLRCGPSEQSAEATMRCRQLCQLYAYSTPPESRSLADHRQQTSRRFWKNSPHVTVPGVSKDPGSSLCNIYFALRTKEQRV